MTIKLRQEEDLHPLEQLSLVDMSYSRLNNYALCPQKYFHTYIEKQERMFGAAATLGNILHSVLEDHVGEPLVFDDMLDSMHDHREDYDPDREIPDDLMDAGSTMLAEFVDRHKGEKFDVVGKEVPFSIVVGTARIRGFIDLVVKGPNNLITVVDYKSGKHEVAQKNVHGDLQLGIYALAMAQLYPDEDIYAELYYLRSMRRKGHTFSPIDLDWVYDQVLQKVNEIINDTHFHPTQTNAWACSFCDFRKNGSCKTGVYRFGKD